MRSLVTFIFLYACDSWTLTAELQRRIQAMEMRCNRKILRISYNDRVTNEEIRAKIQQAIGPHEDLLTIVKRRKVQCCGHVSRSSGLAKTVLQGIMKRGRRQDRQRKMWEDNIRKWTGLKFAKFQRPAENREKWRKLVVKSSSCGASTTLAVKGWILINARILQRLGVSPASNQGPMRPLNPGPFRTSPLPPSHLPGPALDINEIVSHRLISFVQVAVLYRACSR